MPSPQTAKEDDEPANEAPNDVWPPLNLTIEELDEPVFQPQQIVPNNSSLDQHSEERVITISKKS